MDKQVTDVRSELIGYQYTASLGLVEPSFMHALTTPDSKSRRNGSAGFSGESPPPAR